MAGKPSVEEAALKYAADGLRSWIRKKVAKIDKESPVALLGPSMDRGTYYYRFGRVGGILGENAFGWGYTAEELVSEAERLRKLGLPAINNGEINAVNTIYFSELSAALPKRHLVAKHFPGGTQLLETTEMDLIHFSAKDYPIAEWIKGFAPAKNAFGMMLSHATYDLAAFPDIEKMDKPKIPDFINRALRKAHGQTEGTPDIDLYSQVPASLNPYVTQYLRQQVGFKGAIVGDWYKMISVSSYVEKLNFDDLSGTSQRPGHDDKTLIMAISAGVNYVRPMDSRFVNPQFWRDFEASGSLEFQQFEERLNSSILGNYERLRKPSDPIKTIEDLKKVPLMERIDLVGDILDVTEGAIAKRGEKKHSQYQDASLKAMQAATDKELYRVINIDHVVATNDLYSRTGVLTMQFRAKAVEFLSGGTLKVPDAPIETGKEEAWLKGLIDNPEFKKIYDRVNWDEMYQKINLDNVVGHKVKPPAQGNRADAGDAIPSPTIVATLPSRPDADVVMR